MGGSSCEIHMSDPQSRPDTQIPLSVFQQWYTNFTRKIENDKGASFLDRED